MSLICFQWRRPSSPSEGVGVTFPTALTPILSLSSEQICSGTHSSTIWPVPTLRLPPSPGLLPVVDTVRANSETGKHYSQIKPRLSPWPPADCDIGGESTELLLLAVPFSWAVPRPSPDGPHPCQWHQLLLPPGSPTCNILLPSITLPKCFPRHKSTSHS